MRASGSKCCFAPDAKIVGRDAAFGGDGRRFGEHQRGAADRAGGQVGEVPIVGEAIDAGILAHRRDPDAIGENGLAQPKFAEQMRHEASLHGIKDDERESRARDAVAAARSLWSEIAIDANGGRRAPVSQIFATAASFFISRLRGAAT